MVVSQWVSQEEVCVDVGADPATAMKLVQKMQTTNVQLDQAGSSPPEIKAITAGGGEVAKPEDKPDNEKNEKKPKKPPVRKEKPLASWHLHC